MIWGCVRSEGYWKVPGRGFDIAPFMTEAKARDYIRGRGVAWLDPATFYLAVPTEPVWVPRPRYFWWRKAVPPESTATD